MSRWQVRRQCAECPWRKDVPPGQFPPSRYEELRGSVEQGMAPMFACHKTPETNKKACVGYVLNQVYLAENGPNNFNLRYALARGKIDPERMKFIGPQYLSYDEMTEANKESRYVRCTNLTSQHQLSSDALLLRVLWYSHRDANGPIQYFHE